MTVPFEDDADRRGQLESLGEQWVIDDRHGYGILDEDYEPQDLGSGHSVEATTPVLMVCAADFPDVRVDSQVRQVAGEQARYVVAHPPEPTRTGMVRLRLNTL